MRMVSVIRKEYVYSTSRALLYAVAYVFLEWLFLVTKPSFLAASPFAERIAALLIGSISFYAVVLVVHIALCVVALLRSKTRRQARFGIVAQKITPASFCPALRTYCSEAGPNACI